MFKKFGLWALLFKKPKKTFLLVFWRILFSHYFVSKCFRNFGETRKRWHFFRQHEATARKWLIMCKGLASQNSKILLIAYISGFMKKALKNLNPITHISPWFHYSLRPFSSHVKGEKYRNHRKGRQWKKDKRVEKENKDWLFLIFISSPLSLARKKRPLKADFQSVLRTLESLFTTFALFHVRRHKM